MADPSGDDSRRLFSHFLWNAGLQLAEFIEAGVDELGRNWSVRDQPLLELGAGTGLAGIIATLAGAGEVVISDYPAPEVLSNISSNIKKNIKVEWHTRCKVQGHEWGALDNEFSANHKGYFARILVADCLWMPWQHDNLAKSISNFLREDGRAWVVSGFHTGREKMKGFYDAKVLDQCGLEVEKIWERDAEGKEREWMVDRGVEDVTARKRWLVIAVLKKKGA